MTEAEIKILKVAKVKCMQSSLFFTRYFFKKRFQRKFVYEIGGHHEQICHALDEVLAGRCKRLMINIPPRYGKTELAVKNFIALGLALNPSAKFIHLSYSDDLALDSSEEIRDFVMSDYFQQMFAVPIKQGSRGKKKWTTAAGGGVYATSTGGQVTGFGAGRVDIEEDEDLSKELDQIDQQALFGGALVIDDSIKPDDADNELARTKVNTKYDTTMSNRVNSRNTPIVLIGHRLHENDLFGHILAQEPGVWTVLTLSAIRPDGKALWEFKQTLAELRELERIDPVTFGRQYMQDPQPREGRLYKTFKTYKVLPKQAVCRAVCDTADEGSDYLCNVIYLSTRVAFYIVDVYYTQDGMETTEGETAARLSDFDVRRWDVESNNGGRAFSRAVEKIMREEGNMSTTVKWYHQSDNKESRIFNNAAAVQNMIHYPEDWVERWPAFAKHVRSYMAKGKNSHDDAEDTLTMIIEVETKKGARGYSS